MDYSTVSVKLEDGETMSPKVEPRTNDTTQSSSQPLLHTTGPATININVTVPPWIAGSSSSSSNIVIPPMDDPLKYILEDNDDELRIFCNHHPELLDLSQSSSARNEGRMDSARGGIRIGERLVLPARVMQQDLQFLKAYSKTAYPKRCTLKERFERNRKLRYHPVLNVYPENRFHLSKIPCIRQTDGTKENTSIPNEQSPEQLVTWQINGDELPARGFAGNRQNRTRLKWLRLRSTREERSSHLHLRHRAGKMCVEKSMDVLIADRSRLFHAVTKNNIVEVTEILSGGGISPNICDHHHRTPLHIATSKGYTDMVALLLRYGADPDRKDSLGNTCLHLAACTNNVEIVLLLMKSEKRDEEIKMQEWSPGMNAAQVSGIDISSTDFRGYSPLNLAQSKLRILKQDRDPSVKAKVKMIVDMLMTFLGKKEEPAQSAVVDTELLSMFQNRLQISETPEQVNTEIDNLDKLLSKMGSLDISCGPQSGNMAEKPAVNEN